MGWHYAARMVFNELDGEVEYELCECFPDLVSRGYADTVPHTVEKVSIAAESPKKLAEWLRQAADDVEKYEPIEEEDNVGC